MDIDRCGGCPSKWSSRSCAWTESLKPGGTDAESLTSGLITCQTEFIRGTDFLQRRREAVQRVHLDEAGLGRAELVQWHHRVGAAATPQRKRSLGRLSMCFFEFMLLHGLRIHEVLQAVGERGEVVVLVVPLGRSGRHRAHLPRQPVRRIRRNHTKLKIHRRIIDEHNKQWGANQREVPLPRDGRVVG